MATTKPSSVATRGVGFTLYTAAVLIAFFAPLRELVLLATSSDLHSHTLLIPVVSVYFLVTERRGIFSDVSYAFLPGTLTIVAGTLFSIVALQQGTGTGLDTRLAGLIFSLWVLLLGGFLLFFGVRSFRTGLFALAFLIFMVPLPGVLAQAAVHFLQRGSAELTNIAFRVLGVPFVREDLVFHFSRISVEIAPECSGIRSSLALFITGAIAAHLYLTRWWGRGLLLLAVVPLALVKNTVRIVTLTLLAQYVSEDYLTKSWLHHSGGFVFFLITLALFGGVLLLIRKAEHAAAGAAGSRSSGQR